MSPFYSPSVAKASKVVVFVHFLSLKQPKCPHERFPTNFPIFLSIKIDVILEYLIILFFFLPTPSSSESKEIYSLKFSYANGSEPMNYCRCCCCCCWAAVRRLLLLLLLLLRARNEAVSFNREVNNGNK